MNRGHERDLVLGRECGEKDEDSISIDQHAEEQCPALDWEGIIGGEVACITRQDNVKWHAHYGNHRQCLLREAQVIC